MIDHSIALLEALYVLVTPGLLMSFIFFRRGSMGLIERLAISMALSVAAISVGIFYLNLAGMHLSRATILIVISAFVILSGIGAWLRNSRGDQ